MVTLLAPAFVLATLAPSQQAYIKGPVSDPGDEFGAAVAVSGDTLVIGATRDAGTRGAAHVYIRTLTGWKLVDTLAPAVVDPLDGFGGAVAVDGTRVIVGAPRESSAANVVNGDSLDNSLVDAGAAFVFERSGFEWRRSAYLKAPNPGSKDSFGSAVAVSGDTLVVSAPGEDGGSVGIDGDPFNDLMTDAGAVYVFVLSGSSWVQQAYVKPADLTGMQGGRFGAALALDGDTLIVGAAFESTAGKGIDPPAQGVSLESGAAYVFRRSGTTWSQEAFLKASDASPFDRFGWSVATTGDRAFVGAPFRASPGKLNAVYAFSRTGATWAQDQVIAPVIKDLDYFGFSLDVDDDRLLVGAVIESSSATGINGDANDDSAPAAGAAYLFGLLPSSTWYPYAYIKASNTESQDRFGNAVAIDGDRVLVGAELEDGPSSGIGGNQLNGSDDSGAVYSYVLEPVATYCTPKTSSAGCVTSILTSDPVARPASGAADYEVLALNVQGKKTGLLFGSDLGAGSLPFLGGTLCLQPPLRRGPVQQSSLIGANKCFGSFATTVNDGTPFPFGLDAGPGKSAWYQYWYRDPNAGAGSLGSSLSNAVRLDFE